MIRALILLSVVCLPAHAGISWVDLHVGSLHTKNTVEDDLGTVYDLNPINIGIGLTYTPDNKDASDVRFGGYLNSYEDLSVYVGLNPHTSYDKDWAVGVVIGLVTGYENAPDTNADIMAMFVPHVTYLFDNYRAEVSFVYGRASSALGLTMGVMF